MAYMCIKHHNRECFACGNCQDVREYECPECGKVAETLYTSNVNDEILGCDNCITVKDAYEVLYEES